MPAALLAPLVALLAAAHAGDPYAAALAAHTAKGKVDYAAVKAQDALGPVVAALATAAEPTDRSGRMAFWINAYNALTIDMMADEWPVSSITALDGGKVWDTRPFTVAGRRVTLNDIEHKILRPLGDPRIHAAINCASTGCPPLSSTPYTAAALDTQLDRAAAHWLATNGMHQRDGAVTFNKIFDWYGEDFVKADDCAIPLADDKLAAAACFASKHSPAATAAALRAGGYSASFHDYAWTPNAR